MALRKIVFFVTLLTLHCNITSRPSCMNATFRYHFLFPRLLHNIDYTEKHTKIYVRVLHSNSYY